MTQDNEKIKQLSNVQKQKLMAKLRKEKLKKESQLRQSKSLESLLNESLLKSTEQNSSDEKEILNTEKGSFSYQDLVKHLELIFVNNTDNEHYDVIELNESVSSYLSATSLLINSENPSNRNIVVSNPPLYFQKYNELNIATENNGLIFVGGLSGSFARDKLVKVIDHLILSLQINSGSVIYLSGLDSIFSWVCSWAAMAFGSTVIVGISCAEKYSDEITHIFITPNVLVDLIEQLEEGAEFPSLKRVVCSGGVLSQELVSRFYNTSVADKCSLHYGHFVHEELSFATLSKCEANGSHLLVPIGKPLSTVLTTEDTRVEVVDGQGRKLPAGVVGSLSVNGNQIGDQVRELNDGRLEWLSHKGGGIYYEGHYLNSGELEQKLESLEGVRAARVIQRTGTDGRNYLQCYLTGGSRLNLERLLSEVSKTIPSSWLLKLDQVTTLPLSGNGEIADEQLLKLPVLDQELQDRWQKQLESRSDITEAAVVRVEEQREEPVWHLNDVLSGWQGIGSDQTVDGSVLESQLEDNKTTDRADASSPGGDLEIAADAPQTMTEALLRVAKECPERGLIFYKHGGGEERLGYDKLLEEARCHLSGLQAKGLKPGDAAIIQVNNLREYFPLFWGCVLGGIRPVTVAVAPNYQKGNNVVEKLHSIWQLLEKPPILASKALLESLSNLAQSYPLEGLTVYQIDELKGDSNAEIYRATPDDIIFYQLSSGSTGTSKCIQERHGGIVRHANAAAQFNDYSREDVGLNWLPMDHVVPILTCHLKDTYLGCDQVEIQTDEVLANPLLWLDLIEKYKVDNTWAPNFAFKLVSEALSRSGEKSWDLSSIKNFMNAGEQVTLPVVEEFLQLTKEFGVKEKTMQPAFGMAEVCTCMTYRKEFSCADGVSYFKKRSLTGNLEPTDRKDPEGIGFIDLGGPVNGVEIRITDSNNKLVKEGVIGRFQIRGGVVTPGYLKNPEANEESFVGDDWFNSGDLGFIWEGHLYLTGREKEQIIVNGANFYCYEIEDVVNATAGVEATWSAACGVMDDRTGTEGLAVFYVPSKERKPNRNEVEIDEEEIEQIKQVRQEVTTNLGISPTYVVPVSGVEFPKTTSGKIQRTKLRNGLLNGDYSERLQEIDLGLRNHNTIPAWFYKKEWVRKEPRTLANQQCLTLLLLGADDSLADKLSNHHNILRVSDVQNIEQSIDEFDGIIDAVVNCLTLEESSSAADLKKYQDAQNNGLDALLIISKTLSSKQLSSKQPNHNCQFLVITQKAISLNDQLVQWQYGTLQGLIRSLPQEYPNFSARQIDLDVLEKIDTVICNELMDSSDESEVVYCNNDRLVSRLIDVDYREQNHLSSPIIQDGLYLISGGLGGLALEVARFIRQEYGCRILLIDRLEISELVQERRDSWEALRRGGGIEYRQADICDINQLRSIIESVETTTERKLSGVIHLAGSYHESAISDETASTIHKLIRPKTEGTLVLNELLEKYDNNPIFIHFSSVIGLFGGAMVAGYALANDFQTTFSAYQNSRGKIRSWCLGWSNWDDMGMSHGYSFKEVSKARGYHFLSLEQALASLKIVLGHEPDTVYIGLNKTREAIANQLNRKPARIDTLHAFISGHDFTNARQRVHDLFGIYAELNVHLLEKLPCNDEGQIDKVELERIASGADNSKSTKVAPRNDLEQKLFAIWAQILGTSDFGVLDNFFQIGGHSLMATQVVARIREEFGHEVSVAVLFTAPTIALLAEQVDELGENTISDQLPLRPIDRDKPLPLSFAQQRLWFLDQLESNSATYSIPSAIKIEGEINIEALSRSFNEIVRRHEAVRTRFVQGENGTVQVIDPDAHLEIEHIDMQSESDLDAAVSKYILSQAERPFDLSRDLLIRASLIKASENLHILFFNMHHIASDGWSMGIVVQELARLYVSYLEDRTPDLEELPIQYADFSWWQRQYLDGERMERQLSYWRHKLAGAPPLLELPADYQRPPVQSYRGNTLEFEIDTSINQKLQSLCEREQLTPYMVLLSAYFILLNRYSGQDDLVIGTPIANRTRSELEKMIGFFANTLVLRASWPKDATLRSIIEQVKQTTLESYEHQDLPFEYLVEELQPERNLSYSPLFQVSFVLQNMPFSGLRIPGAEFTQIEAPTGTTKFDLSMFLTDLEGTLAGTLEYSTDLFSVETIEKFINHYRQLLEVIIDSDLDMTASSLQFWSEQEQEMILSKWNQTALEYPKERLIHEWFEAQAELQPEVVALVCGDEVLTYSQLNTLANNMASTLIEAGAGTEKLVGICVERRAKMIAAMLGILKSGSAYVPLDPNYPSDRVRFMLEDSNASILITQSDLLERLPETEAQVICIDEEAPWKDKSFSRQHSNGHSSENDLSEKLAYVIYTSGSTGRPKGVAITHRNASALFGWAKTVFSADDLDGVMACTSICFDLSVFEIFNTLAAGGKIILAENALDLVNCGTKYPVTLVNTVPSAAAALLGQKAIPDTVRIINLAGEALKTDLVDALYDGTKIDRLYDLYGPSEDTTYSTWTLRKQKARASIGRPIANTRAYILDENLQPVVVGAAGELYLAGDGVCRGYLKQPGMTAERYLPDPFSCVAGGRMYKTGDLVRYHTDSTIEYLGRIDHQVKVRGFRIELGEIEDCLNAHPAVKQSVVVALDRDTVGKQLVAYIEQSGDQEESDSHDSEQVDQWETLWEETYRGESDSEDPTFDISGWNSSYDGNPIPPDEMREWLDHTVNRILSLKPTRVLEIGCGTGMILFRVAPHCQHYTGIDFSPSVLSRVEKIAKERGLDQVFVECMSADQINKLEGQEFDLVIINSVAQYFPGVEYLKTVIETAAEKIIDGGNIFLGDMRNLTLMDCFHTSIEVFKADQDGLISELADSISRRTTQEEELLIAPSFFQALPVEVERVSHAQLFAKGGYASNELTKYRYDAVLSIGSVPEDLIDVKWIDVKELQEGLNSDSVIGLRSIIDPRLASDINLNIQLRNETGADKVADLKIENQESKDQLSFNDLEKIASDNERELTYFLNVDEPGRISVVLSNNPNPLVRFPKGRIKDWRDYANNPLQQIFTRKIVPLLKDHVNENLPEYMEPAAFVLMQQFPLTPNGKIDRKLLPAPVIISTTEFEPPRNEIDIKLVDIWSELLNLPKVGIRDNFFDLGGHSLLATQLISRIRQELGVDLHVTAIFETPTITELSDLINRSERVDQLEVIEPVSRDQQLPLSYAQQRMWFIAELEEGSVTYNMPTYLYLKGELNSVALILSIKEIVRRHEVLRTIVVREDGKPVQKILDDEIEVKLIDLQLFSDKKAEVNRLIEEDVSKPFDLSKDLMMRATLLVLDLHEHVLLTNIHHIASDGWSSGILNAEIVTLYDDFVNGKEPSLEPLPIQYADFAFWQQGWIDERWYQDQLAYWEKHLSGLTPVLNLPSDRPRPPVQSFKGSRELFTLPNELIHNLEKLAKDEKGTLFMVLLSGFNLLLSRLSGQDDLVVGSPVANRVRPELEDLIGFFANTLALRTDLTGDPSVSELIGRVRKTTLAAYDNQYVPFEQVVDLLNIERSNSWSPVFQSMFILQNAPKGKQLSDLQIEPMELPWAVSRFDMSISMSQTETGISGMWEYSTDLWDQSSIVNMIGYYKTVLENMVNNPGVNLSEIRHLNEEQERALLLGDSTDETEQAADTVMNMEGLEGLSDEEVKALLEQMMGQ